MFFISKFTEEPSSTQLLLFPMLICASPMDCYISSYKPLVWVKNDTLNLLTTFFFSLCNFLYCNASFYFDDLYSFAKLYSSICSKTIMEGLLQLSHPTSISPHDTKLFPSDLACSVCFVNATFSFHLLNMGISQGCCQFSFWKFLYSKFSSDSIISAITLCDWMTKLHL